MPEPKVARKEILLRLGMLLDERAILIAALAGTTNECFHNLHRPGNLYLIGMGMVTPVAFGLAKALPKRNITALDTDGSLLLSPSILPVVGAYQPKNLCVLVFDNEQLYGTRGGPQSQTAHGTSLAAIASGAGIASTSTIDSVDAFAGEYARFLSSGGPSVIVCKVAAAFSRGEGPNFNGEENKYRLVRLIEESERIKILEASK
jgi:thiamine pyrophosphate-dependent acetolactate synthase large subunit-like protein